jgi:hypothetical protein
VGLLEDAAGTVQAGEKRGSSPGTSPGGEELTGGDPLGPLGQTFGTEQLAADGSGEPILARVRAEPGSEEGERLARAQRDSGGLVVSMLVALLGQYKKAMGYGLWAVA